MYKLQLKTPPPIYLALTGVIMWWFNLLAPQSHFTGNVFSVLIALFISLGLILDLTALWLFLIKKTTSNPLCPHKTNQLVTSGWYRFSRNPMYLGMVLLLIGWALYLGNGFTLILIPAFILVLTVMQIKPEEVALKKLFGEQFEHYCQHVRRWI